MKKLFTTLAALTLLTVAAQANNNPVKEAAQDTAKHTKKGVNAVKDATCEMFNSKGECIVKKAGHKLQNAGEEIKDKAND